MILCCNAESAFLLGKLIHGAPRLVLPYVAPVLKALVAKLRTAAMLPAPLTPAPAPGTKAAAKCEWPAAFLWFLLRSKNGHSQHCTAAMLPEPLTPAPAPGTKAAAKCERPADT